jgi:hypothetical protein
MHIEDEIWAELQKSWPSPIIARSEIGKWSGGLLNPRTVRNLDCSGDGPRNRLRVGRKTAYRVVDLIDWLRSRAE